jgi:hypothetical protein
MRWKHISGADLSWRIVEEFSDPRSRNSRISLAVVPDDEHGWRIIVANRVRKFLSPADRRPLSEIERTLRAMYELRLN